MHARPTWLTLYTSLELSAILVCLMNRADHRMNNPTRAAFQFALEGGLALGSGGTTTNDLARALRTTFDSAAEQLLDSLFCRDFIQRPSGFFDSINVLSHERLGHVEESSYGPPV